MQQVNMGKNLGQRRRKKQKKKKKTHMHFRWLRSGQHKSGADIDQAKWQRFEMD